MRTDSNGSEHRRGPPDAFVTLIEYLDYQSPLCAQAEDPIRRVLDAYEGEVALIVRHFPDVDVHEWSEFAALASEAADYQGKFWQMHDLLFEKRDLLNTETIVSIAISLGLDLDRFERDIGSRKCRDQVESNIRWGEMEGVEGTPTFFVNGKELNTDVSFESLSRAISGEIAFRAA